ncbi:hypothetical protein PI125_g23622 [Phytophthora idaei]|nr:hypothetical protein PI125_g23622 [Phytophthora idaei]
MSSTIESLVVVAQTVAARRVAKVLSSTPEVIKLTSPTLPTTISTS